MKSIIECLFGEWNSTELRGLLILITLLGIIVGLITFFIERRISNKNRRRTNRKQWLLEIIIKPEIETIKESFDYLLQLYQDQLKVVGQLSADLEELQKVKKFPEAKKAEIQLAQVKSKFSATYKSELRSRFRTFVALIQEYDKKIGAKLFLLLEGIEDKQTELIGSLKIDPSHSLKVYISKHCEARGKFFYQLFLIVK